MLVTLALPLALLVQYPTTPAGDGAPSFGASPVSRDIEGLFRNPTDPDLQFLASMRDLVVEVHTQLALAEARAIKRGLLNLLPTTEPGSPGFRLEQLLAEVSTLAKDPFGKQLDQDQAISLARAVADGELLAYAPLIAAAREDVPLLLSSLDLLHGHTHGLVQLIEDSELSTVTASADLAAARLRAARTDLIRLARPINRELAPLGQEELRVARGIAESSNSARKDYFALRASGAQEGRMLRSASQLELFDKLHAEALGDRRRAQTATVAVAQRLPRFLPIFDSQRKVGEPWAEMSASERAKLAVKLGSDALAKDPLNADLTYQVALGLEFSSGKRAAEPYLDRFLVLRGIRHYDHRTFRDRNLDVFEQYAMLRIADWRPDGASK